MSSPFSTRTTAAALAALIATTTLAACGGGGSADAATTETTVNIGPELVAVAANQRIATGPLLQGTLMPEREGRIRAQVPGPVLDVLVQQGQRVSAGQVLARLDDRALRDAFLSARSGMTTAQLAADNAQRDFERTKRLVDEGALAQQALETAERGNLAAQAQLADAKARLQAAQDNLDRAKITAPFAGIVSERAVSAGDVVNVGAALFTVIDPTTMRLEASVPADQLADVRTGAPVNFAVSGYGDRAFTGTVSSVNPVADPVTRQVRVYVRIPNGKGTEALVGGLFAEGRIASRVRDGLVVPELAVDNTGLEPTVLRLKGGRTERVQVTLGLHDLASERYEVTAGLSAGDTVLVGAARGISPNTPITVSAPTDAKASATR